ncbi:glycosyltransferase [Desulfomonile tiedjei]|uniref:Glycosyltransferase n=1 Tax=Desulfomonile tiedjei (strain ATCC 49306 / DSM 6799 / DCB-1) TaxID=706587 RepID=I4C9Q6_DESTA|nr:glycosyltransferase [Desulfomonile tiedjei]AFM26297.1 glycosyltransferase [Desulfomonile tiedjei DSM 6799]
MVSDPILKIAVISKSNAEGGGASRVADDLAVLLNEEPNVIAHHWLGYPGAVWKQHMRLLFGGRRFHPIEQACRRISRKLGFTDFFTPEIFRMWLRKEVDYDIYHFHDLSTAVSPIGLRWLARRAHVVWTFHDISPFTGGCIFPMECKKWHARCRDCPKLQEWPLLTNFDRTRLMQAYKRKTAGKNLFTAIAPSAWMARQAIRSGMFSQPPRVIPYCVDTDLFQPHDKQAVRKKLGLPEHAYLILVSAAHLYEIRKGVVHALAALKALDRPFSVLLVGNSDPEVLARFKNFDLHVTGYVRDAELLSLYYAAADVFLFPTLADNLPLTVMETMAAGTPTIGFSTGGVPEMVSHKVHGWLAETADVQGLVEGLRTAHDNPEMREKWAKASRAKAVKLYSKPVFLKNHLDFYREILTCGR